MSESRGFRLNNPMALGYREQDRWVGLAVPPFERIGGTTPLCRFVDPVKGIRAGTLNLMAKFDRGMDCVQELITAWAPPPKHAPQDNNHTEAYIKFVCEKTGWTPMQALDLHQYSYARPLVEAIIDFENTGVGNPYSDAQIDRGLTEAGVPPTKPKTVVGTRTIQGAQVAAAATVVAPAVPPIVESIQTLAGPISDAASTLQTVIQAIMPFVKWLPWIVAAIGLAAIGYIAWARFDDWRKGLR